MAKEPVTVDLILDTLQDWVEHKQVIGPSLWLDAAQKLTVLVGDVQDELFKVEQKIAQKKVDFIEGGDSVAKAKVKVEALDELIEAKKLAAKIDRVMEIIRISKLQARMSDDNLRSYK